MKKIMVCMLALLLMIGSVSFAEASPAELEARIAELEQSIEAKDNELAMMKEKYVPVYVENVALETNRIRAIGEMDHYDKYVEAGDLGKYEKYEAYYTGEMLNGEPHGKGVITLDFIYKFDDNYNIMTSEESYEIDGTFVKGIPNGEVTFVEKTDYSVVKHSNNATRTVSTSKVSTINFDLGEIEGLMYIEGETERSGDEKKEYTTTYEYEKGERNGKYSMYIEYVNTGETLEETGEYKNGERHGQYHQVERTSSGKIISEETGEYNKGKKVGWWHTQDSNDEWRKGEYNNDHKVGEWTIYEDGKTEIRDYDYYDSYKVIKN